MLYLFYYKRLRCNVRKISPSLTSSHSFVEGYTVVAVIHIDHLAQSETVKDVDPSLQILSDDQT